MQAWCRNTEQFKARLDFLWKTGGALLGRSSLGLPLKVTGSDNCILAVDHFLWHRRWSHWRLQQRRAHTCTCQACLCSLQRGRGVFKQRVASRKSPPSSLPTTQTSSLSTLCDETTRLFHANRTGKQTRTHSYHKLQIIRIPTLSTFSPYMYFVRGERLLGRWEVRLFILRKQEEIRLREMPVPKALHSNKTNTRPVIKDVTKALSIVSPLIFARVSPCIMAPSSFWRAPYTRFSCPRTHSAENSFAPLRH